MSSALWTAAGWLTGPLMFRGEAPDLCLTIDAEDAFDLSARLGAMAAPTLVIGGDRGRAYGAELFRQTAAGIPGARLLLYPRTGHAGVQMRRRFAGDVPAT